MATQAAEEIRASSYVGFDSITRQIERKLLKRGFQFNVIVVGQSLLLPTSHVRCTGADAALSRLNRPDRVGKVDTHQHHFRLPFDRLKRPSRG